MAELLKKTFKNIGHPVPAWPHIEHKTLFVHNTSPTPSLVIFLQDLHRETGSGKEASGR